MVDWTNIISGVFQNFLNILPYEIVHDNEQGLYFKRGQMQDKILSNSNGMPVAHCLLFPLNYEIKKGKIAYKGPRGGIHWHVPVRDSIETYDTTFRVEKTAYIDVLCRDEQGNGEKGIPMSFSVSVFGHIVDARKYWLNLRTYTEIADDCAEGIAANEIRSRTPTRVISAARLPESEVRDLTKPGRQRRKGNQPMSPLEREVADLVQQELSEFGIEVQRVRIPNLSTTRPIRLMADFSSGYGGSSEEE